MPQSAFGGIAVGALLAALCAGEALAGDIYVPRDTPSINEAINVLASNGDRVHVAPGVYHEAVVMLGKSVSLVATEGPEVTTIDGSGFNAPALRIEGPLVAAVLVHGFTITGGSGLLVEEPDGQGRRGGGVYVETATAVVILVDCIITGNTALGDLSFGRGGGVYGVATSGGGYGGSSSAEVVRLVDCVISNNQTTGRGGGVAGARLENCVVRDNVADWFGGGTSGARLYDCLVQGNVSGQSGGGSHEGLAAERCVFLGNTSGDEGGGLYGGFVALECSFIDNHASNYGGGWALKTGAGPTITDTVFLGNSAGGAGGGLRVERSGSADVTITIERCLFERNTALWGDGVVAGQPSVTPVKQAVVRRCTFIEDGAMSPVRLEVDSSILRAFTPGQLIAPEIVVTYSNVEGGWSGVGNIDAEPLFADAAAGDYALALGSPCIDAGNPALTDPTGGPADMGAYPFPNWVDLGGGVGGAGDAPPTLIGHGGLLAGSETALTLHGATALARAVLLVGANAQPTPFKGGILWPAPAQSLAWMHTDLQGTAQLSGIWPPGPGSGFTFTLQAWYADAAAPFGAAGSNGLRATAP